MTSLASPHWLRTYYFTRAAVAAAWAAAALTVGKNMPFVGMALLIVYPMWDAAANYIDARRNGGLIENPTQALNFVASTLTAIAVAVAFGRSAHAVLLVFGVWAILAGIFQLGTGVRRWSTGAQWAMILSGAQSALAGGHMIQRATGIETPGVADVALYAAFGAFYFFVSAVWLTVTMRRSSVERAVS